MTIYQVKSFESSCVKTKTEVDMHHDTVAMFSRIINSKLYQYLLHNEDEKGPISLQQTVGICNFTDDIFIMVAKTQLPDDEDFCGPPTQ